MIPTMPMSMNLRTSFLITSCALAFLAACDRAPPPSAAPAPTQQPVAVAPVAQIELKDLFESDSNHVIGISYPPQAARYPGLAQAIRSYADAASADLKQAVAARAASAQEAPYELTLNFTMNTETPDIVAVAAEGTSYKGGAHGDPLVARFVWLPRENALLSSKALFVDGKGWAAVSDYTREQLHAALSQRVDSDELPPAERAEVIRNSGSMIDDGTKPVPASFAMFEPIQAPQGGKLSGLRFVFPPYQVGPYVDGVRVVDVPTEVLMPYLAPAYRDLFVVVPPQPAAQPPVEAAQPAR